MSVHFICNTIYVQHNAPDKDIPAMNFWIVSGEGLQIIAKKERKKEKTLTEGVHQTGDSPDTHDLFGKNNRNW